MAQLFEPESFIHLNISKEKPVTQKRSGPGPRRTPPEDIRGHGRKLLENLRAARDQADNNIGGFDNRKIFKFTVQKGFDPDDLRKVASQQRGVLGIEFVSQEEQEVVIGFASENGLAEFEACLSTMAEGGKVTNQNIFYALQNLDALQPEDRKGWALKKYGLPKQEAFLLDIELWPLENNNQHEEERRMFEQWLTEAGITVKDSVKQQTLTIYRVCCDAEQAQHLLNHRDVRYVDLPPSFELERTLLHQDIQDYPKVPMPDESAPGVVVLDSGLATGHPLLGDAVGDAQSFLPGEEAIDEHGHGTLVAGLALYGEGIEDNIRSREFIPALRLFSGRILDKDNTYAEEFMENRIDKAVRYFVKEYGCRVFNLSLGDTNKPYLGGHLKGLSVALDSLSRELGILFVVSAGNLRINADSPKGIQWKEDYPKYLLDDNSRIIEPAPALNVLTVGSLAQHDVTYGSQNWPSDPAERPIARHDEPSPFTRCGPSVDDAIKPELMAYGGNWASNVRADNMPLSTGTNTGLGVVSTSYKFAEGRLFDLGMGTSMAAPQVAHLASSILREDSEISHNMIRALLCTNARLPEISPELFDDDKDFRRVCGYGKVDSTTLYRSLQTAVTLISGEAIENKKHHFYEVPVPDDFIITGSCDREIAVALAYTPAVRSTRIKYRATRIDFRLVTADSLDRVTAMFNKATDDDEYENIPELDGAKVGRVARSKGTAQADVWKFRRIDGRSKIKREKVFVVVTRNDFPWGENLCGNKEKYALVISLRDRQNEGVQLYSQVQARLRAREQIRA